MIFDPLELNYSKVKTYLDCPALYKYMYVDQKRPPLTAPASLGISIHKALEDFHRGGDSLEDLLDSYDGSWLGAGYADAHEQVEYYEKGRAMLKRYWEIERDRKSMVAYIEKNFEFPYGKWRIKGTIDRIDQHPDNTWEIIDYKTGTELADEAALSQSLQLGIYGIGVSRSLGLVPSKITFWFIAFSKKVSVDYDPSREEAVLRKFSETGEKILAGEFEPRHFNCPFCSLKPHCSLSAQSI